MRPILGLCILVATLSCRADDEPELPYPWQVVFLAGGAEYDREAELWVGEWDGSARRLLFRTDGHGPGLLGVQARPGYPLVHSYAPAVYQYVAFDVRSGHIDTIPEFPSGGPLVWAPDGQWFAMPAAVAVDNSVAVQVRMHDGRSPVTVSPVEPGLQCLGPPIEWSPASLDMFFVCTRLADTTFVEYHFRRARRDGSAQDSIGPAPTPPILAWLPPVWSQDGATIALWCEPGDLCVARPDGSDRRRLAIRGTFYSIAWSPGPLIAFFRQDEDLAHWGLWLVRPDGSSSMRIASSREPATLRWSPDGRYLLTRISERGLVAFSADGRASTIVADASDNRLPPLEGWDWVTR